MLIQLRSLLKVRLDGLKPEDYVQSHRSHVDAPATYVPSEDCSATMARYLALFGGKGSVYRRRTLLPRRCLPVSLRPNYVEKDTRVSRKRKREGQLEEVQAAQCHDADELAQLAASASRAVEAQTGYQDLVKRLKNVLVSKRIRGCNHCPSD